MRTHYDEEILGRVADRFYTCARVAELFWTALAVICVVGGVLVSLYTLTQSFGTFGEFVGAGSGVPTLLGWLYGVLFYVIGNGLAFLFRLRAQLILNAIQLERNTRRGAMISEMGDKAKVKSALTAADLPPYPQPELNVSHFTIDLSFFKSRDGRLLLTSGAFSISWAIVSFLTGSAILGLLFAVAAGGGLYWYFQLRDQGVADPLAVMRERTSTVVGNATEAVRNSAQTMATPREQPPAPPAPPPPEGSTAFCSECGVALPADASFCGECGTKVT